MIEQQASLNFERERQRIAAQERDATRLFDARARRTETALTQAAHRFRQEELAQRGLAEAAERAGQA
eukprot:5596309-Prorocentrum_lima.AAC.1